MQVFPFVNAALSAVFNKRADARPIKRNDKIGQVAILAPYLLNRWIELGTNRRHNLPQAVIATLTTDTEGNVHAAVRMTAASEQVA
jgi:hypothetical protein